MSPMLVCHCMGLTDARIRREIRSGASTRRQVRRACGAGEDCGTCLDGIDRLIREETAAPPQAGDSPDPLLAAG
jgi:bacterioferritin-associated ferredoxin